LRPYLKRVIKLSILFLGLHFQGNLYADHVAGSNITYSCANDSIYTFTLNYYWSCAGQGKPPCKFSVPCPTLNITSSCSTYNLPLTLIDSIEVSPLCPYIIDSSWCNTKINPTYNGVKKYIYSGVDTLPPCADWKFSYKAPCCRLDNITNIIAGSASLYLEATLDNSSGGCNNSPVFDTLPMPVICYGQCIDYTFISNEIDGDSLIFELVNPLSSAGVPIPYDFQYSLSTPILPSISFDSTTGVLTTCPNKVAIYQTAIKVYEYRSGSLIGSVMQDIPFYIQNCNYLPSLTLSGVDSSSAYADTICVYNPACFKIYMNDYDSNLTYTMSWDSGINGAAFSVSGNPPVGTFCWTPVDSNTLSNPHTFKVIIEEDSCPNRIKETIYSIIVKGLPNVNATSTNDTICIGDTSNLTATGAQSYRWAKLSNPNDTISSGVTLDVSPDTTTSYIVIGADANLCSDTDTITVIVYPLPLINITALSDTVCANDTANLTATGAKSYLWANLDSPNDTIGTANSIKVSYDTTTTLFVTGIDSNGCVNLDTFTLVVNPRPWLDTIYGSPYICPSDTNIDYRVDVNPGSTFSWNVTGGTIAGGQGTDSIKVNWDSTGSAMVSVVETNSFGCTGDTIFFPVNINVLFTPFAPMGTDTLCFLEKDSVNYSTVYTNGAKYFWQLSGGQIINGDTTHVVLVNWDTAGTYYLAYNEENITIDTVCFNPSDTIWVTILPSPQPKTIIGDFTVCEFDSNLIYSVSDTGGSVYLWAISGGNINNGDSTNSIQVNWDTAGSYTISVVEINNLGCYGDTMSAIVTINSKPIPTGIFGMDTICGPDSLGIRYSVFGDQNSRFEWVIVGGTITSGQGSDTITATWNLYQGTGQLKLVEVSKDSCISDTLTLKILFDDPIFNILVVSDGEIDREDITLEWEILNGTNHNGDYHIFRKANHPDSSWTFLVTVQGNIFVDEGRPTHIRSFEYLITGINVCRDTVTSENHRSILLLGNGDEFSKIIVLNWNHYINWPQNVDEYQVWRKIDNETDYTMFRTARLDTLVIYENGDDAFNHCYRIKAIESGGTHASWSNEVCLEFRHRISIPNAFSPNGDGVNDTWIIESIGKYPECVVQIYNRWGNLVYEKTGYMNNWEGTHKGRDLPDGAYYYILKLNAGLSNVEDTYKGDVTIMR